MRSGAELCLGGYGDEHARAVLARRHASVPARARRRCGGRAGVRGRIRRAAARRRRRSIWHLYQAALAGRDIYYDQRYAHNLEMRDVLEAILTHAVGRRSGDARRDPALHEAVLDQHRPVQQPDRAQVRAAAARRRRSPRPRTRPKRAGATFPRQDGETLDAAARAAASRCSSTRPSIRSSPARRRGAGKDILDRERQQPVRRRDDGGSRRVSTSAIRSTRGW